MRTAPLVACCLLLLAGTLSGVSAAATVTGGDAPGRTSAAAAIPAVQQDNGTAVRHRNPDNRSEPGDLGRVKGYLSGKMGELVVDCSEGIRVGEYDLCDRADEEYPDFLGKYVDLTDRTGDEEDDETAETFNETRTEQRTFANETRTFRATYEEYRAAREAGNTARARRLARELIRTGTAANRSGRALVADLRRIENRTGVATGEGRNATRTVVANITNLTRQVETDLFTPTTLTATRGSSTASLTRPLVVTGRLTAEGDVLANRTIALRPVGDAGRRLTTRTNATGYYRLAYRPVTVPTGERAFRVRYLPRPAGAYLGATTTVSARVRPADVDPALTIEPPARVDYGDRVAVRARLSVDGIGLGTVPLGVTLGEASLGTARTGADGRVEVRGGLPARVPAGDRTLRVAFPLDGRALGPVAATARVEVVESETDLRLTGTQSAPGERRVRVTGHLVTADGDRVRNQPVRVGIDGGTVRTVRTNATGEFATTLSVPGGLDLGASRPVTVNASFDGTGTNLRGTTARTQVSLRSASGDESGGAADGDESGGQVDGDESGGQVDGAGFGRGVLSDGALLAGLAIAGLVALGAAAYLLRRRREAPRTPDVPDEEPTSAVSDAADSEDTGTDRSGPAMHLEAGDARGAILSSYALARDRLSDGADDAWTHWEFYRRCAADGVDGEQLSALERLTELYEMTVFGPDGPSTTAAEEAVDAAGVFTVGDGR
jgi:hypothetical protein